MIALYLIFIGVIVQILFSMTNKIFLGFLLPFASFFISIIVINILNLSDVNRLESFFMTAFSFVIFHVPTIFFILTYRTVKCRLKKLENIRLESQVHIN